MNEMTKEIKESWAQQYPISSNKVFKDLLFNLRKSGDMGLDFVKKYRDVLSWITDIHDLEWDMQTAKLCFENKSYFLRQALAIESAFREVLANKFNDIRGLLEAKGIDLNGLNGYNFISYLEPKPEEVKPEEPAKVEEPEKPEVTEPRGGKVKKPRASKKQ